MYIVPVGKYHSVCVQVERHLCESPPEDYTTIIEKVQLVFPFCTEVGMLLVPAW